MRSCTVRTVEVASHGRLVTQIATKIHSGFKTQAAEEVATHHTRYHAHCSSAAKMMPSASAIVRCFTFVLRFACHFEEAGSSHFPYVCLPHYSRYVLSSACCRKMRKWNSTDSNFFPHWRRNGCPLKYESRRSKSSFCFFSGKRSRLCFSARRREASLAQRRRRSRRRRRKEIHRHSV